MIELLRAKDDIYWENPCDGEKPFCTKGSWYKIIKHTEYTVIFENDLGMSHNWNIDEVDEDFFTIDFEKGFEFINTFGDTVKVLDGVFSNLRDNFTGNVVEGMFISNIIDNVYKVLRYSNQDKAESYNAQRPYENWKMSISKDKFVRCITPLADDGIVVEGVYGYLDKVHNKLYYNVYDGEDKYIVTDVYATDKGYEFVRENKDSGKVSGVEEASDIMDAVTATKEGILASFGLPTDIPTYNPVKNISRNKFLRCVDMCKEKAVFNNLDGSNTYWMDKSPCGKYYYWDKCNRKNEIIYFRGEVDWVEKNYRKDNPEQRKGLADLAEKLKGAITGIGNDEKDPVIVAEESCEDYWNRIKSSGGINAGLGIDDQKKTEWTDKHYNFNYTLTDEDIENGYVKLDVYKVSKVWRIGSKDDSGALWHSLKTIARFGEKNPVEREIRALHEQVKGLAREHGVKL